MLEERSWVTPLALQVAADGGADVRVEFEGVAAHLLPAPAGASEGIGRSCERQ
jgi:hypothetical protein